MFKSASLLHHLNLSLNSTSKTAHLFILSGNNVAFTPLTNNQLLLVDSHLHGHTEALVAHCECTSLPEILNWFRTINAYQYTLDTVTQVIKLGNVIVENCKQHSFDQNLFHKSTV